MCGFLITDVAFDDATAISLNKFSQSSDCSTAGKPTISLTQCFAFWVSLAGKAQRRENVDH